MSECLTQEDAMKMSNERAIYILKDYSDFMLDQNGCPTSEGYFAVQKAIKALESKTEQAWIPVSERLPEDEQDVIVSFKTGGVHQGKYFKDGSANPWYMYRDKCRAWSNVVEAWMPLPEPYKE